uniref:Nucleoplasmin-like domain-containing protein n=1 Tax=Kalanchoe fedtschenkoi TaxID=63787 RepID=A0A7N0USY8_KALFE
MEFWGVEVKAGQPLKVSPGEGKVIHLSQASIGESKKGKDESVPVYVKIGEQKLVIGTLSADKHPQIQYDVVFEKDFELSHNWKSGSIFFCGYRTQNPGDDEGFSGDEFDSDSEDEELPIENGKPELVNVAAAAKPAAADKAKISVQEAAKEAKADSDEDSSDDEDFSDSDDEDISDDGDEKMGEGDSDDEEDSSEEDEKTPTPKKENKKRPTEPENKTPVPSKKAKIATPQKTGNNLFSVLSCDLRLVLWRKWLFSFNT